MAKIKVRSGMQRCLGMVLLIKCVRILLVIARESGSVRRRPQLKIALHSAVGCFQPLY